MSFLSNTINLSYRFKAFILLIICASAGSCATPTSPTGGPRDKMPPKIVSSKPQTGTVNFKGNEIVLNFSDYVERGSLRKALKIEPRLGISHNIDWSKKSVAIQFDRSLPDSTTLIVTIGTDFSDLHGNSLANPYTVAVSTGPTIDKGTLIGKVIDARTGKADKGKRVLLYRKPVDLSQPANYIAETDTGGVFHFSYLSPGTYKAFWVDDINRDGIWEQKREKAQPFSQEFITLRKPAEDSLQQSMRDTLQSLPQNPLQPTTRDTLGILYIANSDTSKPELMGVGLFSNRRLRLRFSENIVLTDSTHFVLNDSTTGTKYSNVFPLYVKPDQPYILFAHSQKALSPDTTYGIQIKNISDVAGNLQPSTIAYFTGSSQKDTTRQRLVGSSVGKGIFPNEPVQVAYAEPITKKPIRDSLFVIVGDSVHKHWKNLTIQRNKVTVAPDSVWKPGKDYVFNFWNPIDKDRRKVKPKIWQAPDLGSIHISFTDSTSKAAARKTILQIRNNLGEVVADTVFTGEVTIKKLAPVKHVLILYQDLNGNGAWDSGTVSPFKSPEPYLIRNNVPVTSGFTSDMVVSFHAFKANEKSGLNETSD